MQLCQAINGGYHTTQRLTGASGAGTIRWRRCRWILFLAELIELG